MELEAAKMIGAGLAAIALAGAGVGIGIIFGKNIFQIIIYRLVKIKTNQNTCAVQYSGLSWGIPSSAPKTLLVLYRNITLKTKLNFFIINILFY